MVKKILSKGTKFGTQEGSGHIHYVWYPGFAAITSLKEQMGYSFNIVAMVERGNMFTYSYDYADMTRIGKIVFDNQLKDTNYTQKLIKKWKKYKDNFYKICDKIRGTKLKKILDKDLAKLYHDFKEAYLEEYAMPLLTDTVGYFCEIEIQKRLKKFTKKKKKREFNRYLSMLTAPTENSFIGEEKDELMKIANKVIDNKSLRDLFKKDSSIILKKLPKAIKREIQKHAKKYFWIQNNYLRSIVLDEIHFVERIKNHIKDPEKVKQNLKNRKIKFREAAENKEKLMQELKVPYEFKEMIKIVDEHAYWQDMRKRANLVADHWITLFLEEISRRKKILFETLYFITPEEIEMILSEKQVDWKEIELRKKVNATVFTPQKAITYNYSDALLLEKEINSQITISGITDIYGTTANVGKVVGKARILMSPSDFKKLVKGDILVTSMTRPEFVPILSKVSAIVTDEGGLTCHAAIISREMDIPCIVGTKIATKILKDGDLVEVNANHGVVKIRR